MEKIPLSTKRWTPTLVPVESWRVALLGKRIKLQSNASAYTRVLAVRVMEIKAKIALAKFFGKNAGNPY